MYGSESPGICGPQRINNTAAMLFKQVVRGIEAAGTK